MIRLPILICTVLFAAALCYPQAQETVTPGSIATYRADSAGVTGAPDRIRIDILRWSTDEERGRLMDAWDLQTAAPGRGGRGAGRGAGRGGAATGRGGRGASGESTPPPAPDAMLAKALLEGPTVGYLWSKEVAGYAIRYAGKLQNPDGSERIVLVTDKRLGAVNDLWNPTSGAPNSYAFTVIELRVKANGEGDGKASLTGQVGPDTAMKMVAIENYDSLPVVFTHVQRFNGTK